MKQVRFTIEPQGNTDEDKRAAKFVEDCMNDMDTTWMDTLSEILSFFAFSDGAYMKSYISAVWVNRKTDP